jgi:hypothetical protein
VGCPQGCGLEWIKITYFIGVTSSGATAVPSLDGYVGADALDVDTSRGTSPQPVPDSHRYLVTFRIPGRWAAGTAVVTANPSPEAGRPPAS